MPQLMIVTLLVTAFQFTLSKDDGTTIILGKKMYKFDDQKTEDELKREAAEEWKKPHGKISISAQSKFFFSVYELRHTLGIRLT